MMVALRGVGATIKVASIGVNVRFGRGGRDGRGQVVAAASMARVARPTGRCVPFAGCKGAGKHKQVEVKRLSRHEHKLTVPGNTS